ncbi:MAG TPA: FemAB family protein [Flavobacteriaceae bacterium]|nr:FemAB family protein [Flavobacteriaceae bacterium]
MEYHQNRFDDFSLLVFEKDKLRAVLPANKVNNEVFSHQGLTFGSLILPFDISAQEVFDALDAILTYVKQKGIVSLTLKLIPEFYNKQKATEVEDYFFHHNARVEKELMVLAVDYNKPLTIHKTKRKHYRNNKYPFRIEETGCFEPFWTQVLVPRLADKHNTKPVHTLAEITMLQKRFPTYIKQFDIYLDNEILAGITLFENETVVKSQYGATTKKGEKTRALDYLFLHLIFKYQKEGKQYFSMGTVTEKNELGYNPGLKKQKEELGCNLYFQKVLKLHLV